MGTEYKNLKKQVEKSFTELEKQTKTKMARKEYDNNKQEDWNSLMLNSLELVDQVLNLEQFENNPSTIRGKADTTLEDMEKAIPEAIDFVRNALESLTKPK